MVSSAYNTIFSVVRNPTTGSGKKRAEQDIGGTDGTNVIDESDNEESKIQAFTVGSQNTAHTYDR